MRITRVEALEYRRLMTTLVASGNFSVAGNFSPAVVPSSTDDLDIPSSGQTLNLDTAGSVNSVAVGGNVAITASSSSDTLTNTTGNFSVASGVTATVSAVLAGTNGLSLSGGGVLADSATNTYTGVTQVTAGTLIANSASTVAADSSLSVGADASAIVFAGGGAGVPALTFTRAAPKIALGNYSLDVSAAGVVFADGDASLSADDMALTASPSSDLVPGVRSYSSSLKGSLGGLGPGWMLDDQPYIARAGSGAYDVVFGAEEAFQFTESDGTFTGGNGLQSSQDTLATGPDSTLTFTTSTGAVYEFDDFSYSDARAGQFLGEYLPGGGSVQVSATDADHGYQISSMEWFAGGADSPYMVEQITYDPGDGAANTDHVASIIVEGWNGTSLVSVRGVNYTYYDGTTSYGKAGDLESATELVYDPSGTTTTVDPTSLQAGRANLIEGRLQVQRQLVGSQTPRYTPIEATTDGVIWDGNHGARAAGEAGGSVNVLIVPGSIPGQGSVMNLPVTRR